MERDKELLLPVEGSDSDDIVEEFKLPPPRTRRPKARKAIAEARIAASNPSLLSWKCCLMFLIVSVFISGVLVLVFFMLSMQSEINKLSQNLAQANIKIQHHDSLEISTRKLMEKHEVYKQKFSKQDLNVKLLVRQILSMNKTIQKISTSNELDHRITALSRDVDSMKTGMASTGGSIAKVQAEIIQHDDKFESVLTELKNVKIALYNTTTRNKTALERLTRPISAQTQQIRKLKLMIRKVNDTNNRNVERVAGEIYNKNTLFDEKLQEIGVKIRSLNDTHNDNLTMLLGSISSIKDKSANDLATHAGGISFLKNFTGKLQQKLDRHHELLKNYTQLETDLKNCQTLSSSNQHQLALIEAKVNKHHKLLMERGNSSSFAYVKEIMQLLNHSKTSESMINLHHKQLKEYMEKINSLKSQPDATLAPTKVTSTQFEKTTIPTSSLEITSESNRTHIKVSAPPNVSVSVPQSTEHPDTELCPLQCSYKEKCAKMRKGYKCVCIDGFEKTGKYCEDTNECLQKETQCHADATCKNTYGSYVCMCVEGFQGNGTYCARTKVNGSSEKIASTSSNLTLVTSSPSHTLHEITKNVVVNGTQSPTLINSTTKQLLATGSNNQSVITSSSNITRIDASHTGLSPTNSSVTKLTVMVAKNESTAINSSTATTTKAPITNSSVLGGGSSQGIPLGTSVPEHQLTTDSDIYMTPEMPDDSGIYDEKTIDNQPANKEKNKDLSFFRSMTNFVKRLDANAARKTGGSSMGVDEEQDKDLNHLNL